MRRPGGAARAVAPRWPGFFVSFEGIDGAGKSTQIAALAVALRSAGHDVVTIREPGDTALGELVRGFVLQHQLVTPLDPWAEALLFVAARSQVLREVILPALDRGALVLADRYADSTLAYQGGGRGLPIDALRRIHHDACGDVWPDLTVLLDLPPDAADHRRHAGELPFDRMERSPADFHAAVHRSFAELAQAEPHRFAVVDAAGAAVLVSQRVWEVVSARLAELDEAVPSR